MNIIKNNVEYHIIELKRFWKIVSIKGKLTIEYKIPKENCLTIDDVKSYILSNDIF